MEITKLVPALLHQYDFSFSPRSTLSPHKQSGVGLFGEESDKEPWNCSTSFFTDQRDFWCDVSRREMYKM